MLVWVGNPELVGMLHIVLLHADKERRGRAHDKKRPGQVTNYQKNKRPSFYTKVKCCRMIDQRIREVQLCKGYRDSLTGDKNRNETRNKTRKNETEVNDKRTLKTNLPQWCAGHSQGSQGKASDWSSASAVFLGFVRGMCLCRCYRLTLQRHYFGLHDENHT